VGAVPPQPQSQQPIFRFRSDQAFLTPDEIDHKARQRAKLQEALEKQVGTMPAATAICSVASDHNTLNVIWAFSSPYHVLAGADC
jgi:hypothetical protein